LTSTAIDRSRAVPASLSSLTNVTDQIRTSAQAGADDLPLVVWEVLDTLVDPRRARGKRHRLATVIALALGAVLAGATSLAAIGDWAGDVPRWSWDRWQISRRPPAVSTIRRVLLAADADVLDAVLHAWLAALTTTAEPRPSSRPSSQPGTLRAVAVDGKTARGAVGADGRRAAMFSMVEHTSGTPLGQVEITGNGEITSFATVLDRIDLHDVVVTADALPTQKRHAHYLRRHGGHYVVIVKANQPGLHARLRALPWRSVPVGHVAHDKGHGRREVRTLHVISEISRGQPRLPFPHARQALRITRERVEIKTGTLSREVVYAVTDLTFEAAGPQLAAMIRGHWAIENRVHLVRDVTFRETPAASGRGPRPGPWPPCGTSPSA
jgi:predicted transposase YbfD/YdcC